MSGWSSVAAFLGTAGVRVHVVHTSHITIDYTIKRVLCISAIFLLIFRTFLEYKLGFLFTSFLITSFLWVNNFIWVTHDNYLFENGWDTYDWKNLTRTFRQNFPCNFAVRQPRTDLCGDAGSQQNSKSIGATCNHHHCKQHFIFLSS